MFCHISVISMIAADFFLPEHLQVGGGQTESKSSTLFTADAETYSCLNAFLRWHFPHFVSPLTNLSIPMLNFIELVAADEYLNLILPKCTAFKCSLNV